MGATYVRTYVLNTKHKNRDGITKKDVAVYRGLLVADQNAKLAAFASRPAVLNYATNTVCAAQRNHSYAAPCRPCVYLGSRHCSFRGFAFFFFFSVVRWR